MIQWSPDLELPAGIRMVELDLVGMQQQSMAVELPAEEVVLFPVSIGGVPKDRVKNMFHVAPYLVIAAW